MNNKKILVVNGPNLNKLGERETAIYGSDTLQDINTRIKQTAQLYDVEVEFFQSNHEGDIVEKLHNVNTCYCGVVINPAAFSHYSIAIKDALSMVICPVIEVHISNVFARETYRQNMLTATSVNGIIAGLGIDSYILAIKHILNQYNCKEKCDAK